MNTKARKGDGVNTCKFCGSENLWGNHFDAAGEGTADGTCGWDVLCEDCGKFQIRRNTPRKADRAEIARNAVIGTQSAGGVR